MTPTPFRPTVWQRAQSYLMPVLLETATSPHNPLLEVVLRRGRFQLLTQNAIYSYADLYDNFSKVFDQIALPSEGGRVLILGWGLGSIPFMLEKTFEKKYEYVGIEIDPQIVRLFDQYVRADLVSPIQLVNTDAEIWVKNASNESTFDLICIDLFLDATIPSAFGSVEFLEKMQQILNPNGQIIFNRLAQNLAERTESEFYFKKTFQTIFPTAKTHEIVGNLMLVGQK